MASPGTFTSLLLWETTVSACRCTGKLDVLSTYTADGNLCHAILDILGQLPLSKASACPSSAVHDHLLPTSFDSITMVASTYTYKELKSDEEPHRNVKLFWAIFLILLPLALIFRKTP
ncbi:MAG: BCCT family transporter [Clostridium sp.]